MSDLLYGEIEDDLRSGLRGMLDQRAAWPEVLAGTEKDEPSDAALWDVLDEIGVLALPVPEAQGGAGASWRETAVVMEELGRAVAPVPFLTSAVIATAALLAAGDELVPQLASGDRTAVLAVPFGTAPDAPLPAVRTSGGRLSGEIRDVADALAADVLLVPTPDGLYAVDAADTTRTPVISLDMTRRLGDLTLADTPGRLVATGEEAVRAGLTAGAALLASEQLGLAERCLEITVAYLKTRYQFGRPVGSYQGLKHRLADLWTSISEARAVARHAASCLATGDADLPVAAVLAQAHCSEVAVRAAEECVQMHGGIGFTWEHPAHLYLKRAKADALALGTPSHYRATLARLLDLPPS
ncbi:acyl-CoA dehydrogenase family protein [Actinomadura rupiterrae]|uniref:acyl-CoA dehydrogenase family protein n=1 Tax=Actinomadura rupiterrae TaxID=559627 RepID=UPI0020A43076|nr:acyl-CoA dehydrogenase family protein [Actinomadura rupiterrae]MCP2341635.1 alkylation response protein AidB-like acyl-CoA dehydrogenase [Actinomadura rupiterrae]